MLKGKAGALRKGRYSEPHRIYHVVISSKQRQSFFSDPVLARHAVICLKRLESEAATLAFVVMPDHIHWLLQLKDLKSLSEVIRLYKVLVRQKAGTAIWQPGFYDHAVRNEESLVDIARYIVMNPVRAGICKNVCEYPWWDSLYL